MRNFVIAMLLPAALFGQSYQPSEANQKARQWFQDARFGMFIHWGVYSVLGDGEWVMNNRKITVADYEKLPPHFNPTEFNAAEWVAQWLAQPVAALGGRKPGELMDTAEGQAIVSNLLDRAVSGAYS